MNIFHWDRNFVEQNEIESNGAKMNCVSLVKHQNKNQYLDTCRTNKQKTMGCRLQCKQSESERERALTQFTSALL